MIWIESEGNGYYTARIGPLFADIMEFDGQHHWEIGFESDDQPRDVVCLDKGLADSLAQAQERVTEKVHEILQAIAGGLEELPPAFVEQPMDDSSAITRPIRKSSPGLPSE
jgi:hypothetical protein